ncbi:unnamed protein product [Euphydryas editha]|uniref:Uncharacterized protein n=1 Tax=Euphydryas editha TaxID=104508 RepID=A0AAU9UL18_EUPED|nr:unnamed protein product [Euphydryas editha]
MGEVETQGTFDDVSKTKLFEELLQEEELEDDVGNRGQLLRQRTMSIQSHSSVSTTMDNTVEELEKEAEETTELMEKGRVSSTVYMKYFRAGAGWALLSSTVFSILLAQVITSGSDLWLTHWMNDVEDNIARRALRENITNSSLPSNRSLANDVLNTFNDTSSLDNLASASTMKQNLTVIDTMMKTAFEMKNITSNEEQFDHTMYVYVWAIAIFGCILLTTTR